MTRKLTLSLSLMTAGLCFAAPLTPEEALSRLDMDLQPATRSAASISPAMTLSTPVGEPALYLFETKDNQGFMIVSADDAITPLLGYSDINVLDPDNLPPAMEAWLNQYCRQIDYARENGLATRGQLETRASLPSSWKAVGPLLKTTWNQDAPFNNSTPLSLSKGVHCPTGCVATSMAQVMNYFKYPEKGQNSISYPTQQEIQQNIASGYVYDFNVPVSLNFANVTFDWDNMLNSYNGQYSATQADAVATLMKAAGYSVQMTYTNNYSGAVSGYIPGALYNYFNYDKDVTYVSRALKTYSEWAELIYNNIKNVGPVIYDGDTSNSEGHSFVCDGYNGNGYFHFNWGWGGAGDGYFLLDSLNPSAIGIGGAYGGFDYGQDVVLNIKKPQGNNTDAPIGDIIMSGSMEGYASNTYLYMKIYGAQLQGLRYYGLSSMTFDFGLSFTPENGGTTTYVPCSNLKSWFQRYFMPLEPGYILYCDGDSYPYPMFTLSGLGLDNNVKYKATAIYRPEGTENWLEIPAGPGCYNYFYITKTSAGYEFENFPQDQFTCESLQLDTDLYFTKAVEVSMSLKNNTNTELTRSAILVLLDKNDNVQFLGDSFVETLSAGETKNLTYVTELARQFTQQFTTATDYYLGLLDLDTETIYYKSANTVTMMPNPGAAKYTCKIWIDNGELLSGYDNYSIDFYQVENSQDIDAVVEIDVASGIFSSPINIYGGQIQSDGNIRYPLMTYPLDLKIIDGGETDTYNMNINFSSAEPDKMYCLIADVDADYSINQGTDDIVGFIPLTNEAGVESLVTGNGDLVMVYDHISGKLTVLSNSASVKSVEVYSLNGMKLSPAVSYEGGNAQADLSSLGKGIVMVNALDSKGQRKSVKLAL